MSALSQMEIGDSGLHFLCHFLRECVVIGRSEKEKEFGGNENQ